MSVAAIVGLGNPGPRYAATRHNAGFWLVDRLVEGGSSPFRANARFHGEVAKLAGPAPCWVLKPATYMNRSGQSVAALARFYRLEPEQLLVVHDELDLPPGIARLKRGGGHGGHNGLRDIAAQLGSRDFLRLRIGIGHPGSSDQVVDYVLQRPSTDDARLIEGAIDGALEALPLVLEGQFERAMNGLHTTR